MNLFNFFKKKELQAESSAAPQKQTKPKILIVEDETDIRDVYVELLQAESYEILTAGNGQEALTMTNQHHPDVILLDVMMPVLDGMQVLDQLKSNEQTKQIPVIMLTNAGNIDNMESAKYHKVFRFLIKSNIVPAEVVKTTKDALASGVQRKLS